MFGFSKHDIQVSYTHPWVQAGRSVSSAYTLSNGHPKIPKITDVYHLLLCLFLSFGQGHHQTCARIHLLLGEPSPLALPGRSTGGDLHARRLQFCSSSMPWCYPGPGKVCRTCRAWSLHVAAVMLDTAIIGSSSPF